ncbi:MAG: hypothetical protein ACXAD7_07150 [Candidatus Kariarchaeaceae archaeon]|jgi:hypothetical protein
MKIRFEDVELSGKGFFAEENQEWLDDNLKLVSHGIEFHEVIHNDNGLDNRIGWIAMGKISLVADFTAHSEDGMIGRSVEDSPEYCFIYDKGNLLGDFVPEVLINIETDKSELLLKKHDWSKINGDIHLDKGDEGLALIILSLKSNLVFVQSPKASVRICNDVIMVLNKDETKDNLTIISKEDGILHFGQNKTVSIGKGSIKINGQEFTPEKILKNVTKSINNVIANLKFEF